MPSLLPRGRPVGDDAARDQVEREWGCEPGSLPRAPGRDTSAILGAAAGGSLSALVVGGVDPDDLPDPRAARAALEAVDFVLSLELRHSPVTERADVVLPVAPHAEKSGTYLNWEGRPRPFDTTLQGTGALPDCRVLDTLAAEMDVDLLTRIPRAAAEEMSSLGTWQGHRQQPPGTAVPPAAVPGTGQVLLATWRMLLDAGSLQDGEPHLAGTAKRVEALLGAETARRLGVEFGATVTVETDRGSLTLPAAEADLPPDVVWLPTNSPGCCPRSTLGAGHGDVVGLRATSRPGPEGDQG